MSGLPCFFSDVKAMHSVLLIYNNLDYKFVLYALYWAELYVLLILVSLGPSARRNIALCQKALSESIEMIM